MARAGSDSLKGLWIGVGAFFLVFSCAPLGHDYRGLLFFWDLFAFGGNTMFGVVAIYLLIAGIGLIVLANLERSLPRGLVALGLGAVGIVFAGLAVAGGPEGLPGARQLDFGEYGVVVIPVLIGLVALLVAMVGNNVRIHCGDSRLGKMLGGIGACVAGTLLIVGLVIEGLHLWEMIQQYPLAPRFHDGKILPFMLSTYPAPQIACALPLVFACLLMGLNLADSPKAWARSRSAQKLAFLGLGLLGAWMILGPTVVTALGGDGHAALWGCLRRIRMIGVPYCLMLMVGGGMADAIRSVLSASTQGLFD